MIKEINDYTPLGNAIDPINDNFSYLNIRACNVKEEYTNNLEPFFNFVQSLSSAYNQLVNVIEAQKDKWNDTSTIVHNTAGYWLQPITVVYPYEIIRVVDHLSIEAWLNTTFQNTTFAEDQIIQVVTGVRDYDPNIFNGTTVFPNAGYLYQLTEGFGYNYFVANHAILVDYVLQDILNSINYIIGLNNRNDLKIAMPVVNGSTDHNVVIQKINTYLNSYPKTTDEPISTTFSTFSKNHQALLYAWLNEYSTLYKEWETYGPANNAIPLNYRSVINQGDIQTVFFNKTCYKKNKTLGWKLVTRCIPEVCVPQTCSDCYGYVDPNTLYDNTICKKIRYKVVSCLGSIWGSVNDAFREYVNSYIDIIINGVTQRALISNADATTESFPLLTANMYTIIGLAHTQSCGPSVSISASSSASTSPTITPSPSLSHSPTVSPVCPSTSTSPSPSLLPTIIVSNSPSSSSNSPSTNPSPSNSPSTLPTLSPTSVSTSHSPSYIPSPSTIPSISTIPSPSP